MKTPTREDYELAAKSAKVFMCKEDWPFSDPFDPKCLQTTVNKKDGSITGTRLWYSDDGEIGGTEQYSWNPLTDDGDSRRLEVAIGCDVVRSDVYISVHQNIGNVPKETDPSVTANFADHNNDKCEAARHAVFWLAVEIGRAMP